jgi:hypothetical protein
MKLLKHILQAKYNFIRNIKNGLGYKQKSLTTSCGQWDARDEGLSYSKDVWHFWIR